MALANQDSLLEKIFVQKIKNFLASLAEKVELSVLQINGIECGRKFVSTESLLKIANALGVEVYELFVPQDKTPVKIEKTPENEKIREQITNEVVEQVRRAMNSSLDKIKS